MNKKALERKIKSLKPWYQEIDFGNDVIAKSSHSTLSGEYAWQYIKPLLPDLEGKRVLDLGSNAGLFSVRCAQMGAKEVIGIEKSAKHLKQCKFVKEYFNVANVRFINANLESLYTMGIGKFDVILAIAVLYWVGRVGKVGKTHYDKKYRDIEFNFIKYVTTLSDFFVIRTRGAKYNRGEYYSKLFGQCGFDMTNLINEDVGRHEMITFERRK